MSEDNKINKKKDDCVPKVKEVYLKVLLQQYSECWQSIRNDSNSVWQIPTLLITTISVLAIAYAQFSQNLPLNEIQTARILLLLLGFGFTLVSLIALIKHRFFCKCRTEDFNEIQRQLKALNQEEFKPIFDALNKNIGSDCEKARFREIWFESSKLARNRCCIYHTSAYHWQCGLIISTLIGIVLLLAREFVLLVHA